MPSWRTHGPWGFVDRPAGDVVSCLHITQLFNIRLHPAANEPGMSGVHLQVSTAVIHGGKRNTTKRIKI